MKICSTQRLKLLNADAVSRGFHRAIADAALDNLDPDGVHVLSILLLHNESEYRCLVCMKLRGVDDPRTALLDVDPADYNRLEGVPAELLRRTAAV